MISGFSGLPKFMLSVSASGSAPTAVRLRQFSATACMPPRIGIGAAVARRAVGGQRQRLAGLADPNHRGVAAGALDGVALHEMVVLLPDPALRGEVGAGDQLFEACDRVALGQARRVDVRLRVAAHPGPLVNRRLGDQRPDRDVGGGLAVHAQHQAAGLGDPADHREIELPFLEDPARLHPRCPARRIISMRSWLSLSMIS